MFVHFSFSKTKHFLFWLKTFLRVFVVYLCFFLVLIWYEIDIEIDIEMKDKVAELQSRIDELESQNEQLEDKSRCFILVVIIIVLFCVLFNLQAQRIGILKIFHNLLLNLKKNLEILKLMDQSVIVLNRPY